MYYSHLIPIPQIQIITIVIVNFAMFPMFSAMMTQFVHDTKEEASKKMQEMKEQVSKKN
jgi:multisubunit Na+/H+ antiporter MnhC subunit